VFYGTNLITTRTLFKSKAVPQYTPWMRLGGKYSSYSLSTSVLDGGEWSASRSGRALAPGKGPPGPPVLEAGWTPVPVWTQRLQEEIISPLPVIEPGSPGHPVRSQTLHWLSYPCSRSSFTHCKINLKYSIFTLKNSTISQKKVANNDVTSIHNFMTARLICLMFFAYKWSDG
jgi:hypothetical protein